MSPMTPAATPSSNTKACAAHAAMTRFADLANLGERDPDDQVKNWPRARAIVEAVAQALAPLTKIMSQKEVSLSAFADALSQSAESFTK